jgi:catechol 2,3-dioxygenase-like lactoylglutathione lyase family enzyme
MNDRTKLALTPAASPLSRRTVLSGMGMAAVLPFVSSLGHAQSGAPASAAASSTAPAATGAPQLPLKTTGLEHMGTVVPDVAAAGKFYGRLFNPELHKEKELPLRYYVTLGVGYLALGSRANETRAFFDHFCALVQDYDAKGMAQELQAGGLPAGRYGIIPDPDAIGLQLLGVPGGLAKSTEPAGRIVQEDALVKPKGLDQVVLHVADLEKSVQFYRKFFGKEASRTADQAWFQIVNTRLGIEVAPAGGPARIDRIVVKCEPFDRASVRRELTKLGAKVAPGTGKSLRFTDPIDLGIELLPA